MKYNKLKYIFMFVFTQVQNEIEKNGGGKFTDEFMNMTSCKKPPVDEPQSSNNENQMIMVKVVCVMM